jgi:hypothetical protein
LKIEEEVDYEDFRTELVFKDVYTILKLEQKKKYEFGEYMFITRHTVLGRWREIKLKMYRDYLRYINNTL